MKNIQDAVTLFSETLERISKNSKADDAYIAIRSEAEKILEKYKNDPLNTELIFDCTNIVRRIENLEPNSLGSTNFMRSRSNVVYVSALAKRTHYAAYMAGVWSVNSRISKPFKVWMNNSAADGAITLYEAALPFINGNKEGDDRQLLSIFAEGAIHDAERFLEMADRHFPECAVTRYNKARVDIYHIERDRVRQGVEALKSIPCPSSDSDAPELIWHKDNYESFQGDNMMRNRIQQESPEDIDRIEQVLSKNFDEANMQIQARGAALWQPYSPYAKTALVGVYTGIVAIFYAVLGDASLLDLLGITSAHADVLSAASEIEPTLRGGGGFATLDFTRTMGFGGGGLA